MTRKEIYEHIKGLGLQEEIKATYGRNYTQVSSADLEKTVKEVLDALNEEENKKCEKGTCDCQQGTLLNYAYEAEDVPEIVGKLICVLFKKHILLPSEIAKIMP